MDPSQSENEENRVVNATFKSVEIFQNFFIPSDELETAFVLGNLWVAKWSIFEASSCLQILDTAGKVMQGPNTPNLT